MTDSPPSDSPPSDSPSSDSPPSERGVAEPSGLGPNAWLVDEMYLEFLASPSSVSEPWREFFADYVPPGGHGLATRVIEPTPHDPDPHAEVASSTAVGLAGGGTAAPVMPPHAPNETGGRPGQANEADGTPGATIEQLRGARARIVDNMESSLEVPTATSFREVPAKLLEVNRSIINGFLGRTRGGKVSFTHLIGYAVVRAIVDHVPAMNRTFARDAEGRPTIATPHGVGLGLAIDMEKADGTRSLLVPCIKNADSLDFADFVARYDDLVRRANNNRLTVDDFAGATVTLTNPGTIGTERSVPRLMPGQATIVGVGALAFPASFAGADPSTIADLGFSKVITISSTYDHRIIQGAESGLFLKRVQELLLGQHDFYEAVFHSVGVPYTAVEWRPDVNPVDRGESAVEKQMQVANLINMHRVRGHLIANLDPLASNAPEMHAELDPATYGLTIWDLEREFLTGSPDGVYAPVGGALKMKLGDILHTLRDAYCRTLGIEYTHIQSIDEKRWIQEQVEGVGTRIEPDVQRHILDRLNAAEALEKFLATKYVGQKRFGLEGAESAIPILDELLDRSAESNLAEAVIGMAHRGRLNVLVNIVGKAYTELFAEFEGHVSHDSVQGSGDVKYHLGQQGTFTSRSGRTIPVELAANPSHLEAVDPVVTGMARAKMDKIPKTEGRRFPVLPILIHGDAAFAGQGVVAETLNLSLIKGYRVGGTIHLIINNQLGFTTPPASARSSEYCTDVAKTVQAPIFHVNGDDPEACIRVARLAFEYRRRFEKDVVIDMVCYRRHGHNEGDDPSYTQPLMYQAIDRTRSVRKLYTEALVRRGDITVEEAERALVDFNAKLAAAFEETRAGAPPSNIVAKARPPADGVLTHADTATTATALSETYAALSSVPDGFTIHPKLARQFAARDEMYRSGEVDWALAEAFALGSLLLDGVSVRLAGQDSRRGTFSQRHSTLVDFANEDEYVPLSSLRRGRANLWIYDSLLSEYAALGFEYGYSVAEPSALVMWEAQFGDFGNGAQIIIDQFLVAAEDKWDQTSGLVMLLPHGYEGQGPEHSSARIERFLLLAAEDNIQVCNATTAAQYFHLLRRQMVRDIRKPLVVFTPKSGLRAKTYRSPVAALTQGTFEELLDDPTTATPPDKVTRVVLASGKIAHDALARRDQLDAPMVVLRVEQLFPWPYDALAAALDRYPNCQEIVWLQEEPENMGPWQGIKGRLYEAHGDTHDIRRISRDDSGSPATGKAAIHAQEHEQIITATFAELPDRDRREARR